MGLNKWRINDEGCERIFQIGDNVSIQEVACFTPHKTKMWNNIDFPIYAEENQSQHFISYDHIIHFYCRNIEFCNILFISKHFHHFIQLMVS